MTLVKRHRVAAFVGLWAVLVGGGRLLVWMTLSQRPAHGQEGATTAADPIKLDAEGFGRLRSLRQRLCLGADDLAAMGCNGQTAEGAVRALAEWYMSRKVELRDARRAVNQAKQNLRDLSQKLHIRSPDAAALQGQYPRAKAAWENAVAAEKALVETAVALVEGKLSVDQRAVWGCLRANVGVIGRYKAVPELTASQLATLGKAMQTRDFALAGARTAAQRASATEAFAAAEARALSFAQKQAMDAAAANRRACSAAVADTCRKVLPAPAARGVGAEPGAGG